MFDIMFKKHVLHSIVYINKTSLLERKNDELSTLVSNRVYE